MVTVPPTGQLGYCSGSALHSDGCDGGSGGGVIEQLAPLTFGWRSLHLPLGL